MQTYCFSLQDFTHWNNAPTMQTCPFQHLPRQSTVRRKEEDASDPASIATCIKQTIIPLSLHVAVSNPD